jgi:hypothetical protein
MLRRRNRLDLETDSSLLAEIRNKAPAALLRRREEAAKRELRAELRRKGRYRRKKLRGK